MSTFRTRRRTLLKGAGAAALALAAPAIVRAQPKQLLIAGPSAQAKTFETYVQPLLEKKLGVKVLLDGSTSVKHMQVLLAQKSAPTYALAWMPDSEMVAAAQHGLLAPLTATGVPNLQKIFPAAIRQDALWVQFKISRFSVGVNTERVKPPLAAWAELWEPRFRQKVMVPTFSLTQGPMMLTIAAHLESGKPLAQAQYDTEAGLRKLQALRPNILNVFTASPQALNLLEQGEAHAVVGLFSSMLYPRMSAGMPIDLPTPKEGAFGSPNCIGRIAEGPLQDAAEALIDALLEPDLQQIMMERSFDSPVRPEVTPSAGVVAADRMTPLDPEYWGKHRAQIAERYAAALS
jgi:putative spermidine/putrescine transport system substrate-binding protein